MGAIVNLSTKLRAPTPEVGNPKRVHLVIKSIASKLRRAPKGTPKGEPPFVI
jgi:hypothetical protein